MLLVGYDAVPGSPQKMSPVSKIRKDEAGPISSNLSDLYLGGKQMQL
jgi:hypothetical protein